MLHTLILGAPRAKPSLRRPNNQPEGTLAWDAIWGQNTPALLDTLRYLDPDTTECFVSSQAMRCIALLWTMPANAETIEDCAARASSLGQGALVVGWVKSAA